MIHWEWCKKLKYDQTIQWYMHKPEFVQKDEAHKILSDFEMQTDHVIPARRPDLVMDNKKENQLKSGLFPINHRVKIKENEKIDKCLDLARGLKKLWNMKVTVIPIAIGALGRICKGLVR